VQKIGVKPIDPLDRFFDVIDFEAKVIDALIASGALGELRHADDSVADVAAIRVGLARVVNQTGGDLLHAEDCLIELELGVVAFGVGGEVADFCDHSWAPSEVCGLSSF